MKHLSDYMDAEATRLHEKHGAFYAFSKKQYNEAKKEGVEYVSLQNGLMCPKDEAKEFVEQMLKKFDESVAQDLAENGMDGIILRELINHEAFYVGDIDATVDALECYEFSDQDIIRVFNAENKRRSKLHNERSLN